MLQKEQFKKNELEKIKQAKINAYNYSGIFFKILVPLSFLLGFSGLLFRHSYWSSTLFFLSGFLIAFIYLTFKEHYFLSKDLKEKIKYVGMVTIVRKERENEKLKLYLDSREIKLLSIYSESTYDQIDVGNTLYLEIAKNSKIIFKLKKEHVLLLKSF